MLVDCVKIDLCGSGVNYIQVKKVFEIIRTHFMQKQESQLRTFELKSIFTI